MKKMIHKDKKAKNIATSRRLVALLCPLIIAGCGYTPPALKPFVFEMTRINLDGSINDGKDFAKQPWACVLDNQSGLVWEVKRAEPGLHHINNTYSWYDPNKDTNGGLPGSEGRKNGGKCTGSSCDTDSYIKATNAEKLCGYTDWYLPSRMELNTIVDNSVFFPGPTFPKSFFPESLPGKYWTDTTFKTNRATAWIWRFDYGQDYVANKTEDHSVRLAHATKKPTGEPVDK